MEESKLQLSSGYKPQLALRETEVAIKQLKDFFEHALAKTLNLTRVSAPLFVLPKTGLNDNLNGVERPVSFGIKDMNEERCEIVQSLAKWKRMALKMYGFEPGEGLYTDMNAIRPDEEMDNLHSIYVDQWDWERIVRKDERTVETLQAIVRNIYQAFLQAEDYICNLYPELGRTLPANIHFITTQELEDLYPQLSPREREDAIVKEKGAVFVMQIGGLLKSGIKHDGRAPDYDDWALNGDIILWNPVLQRAFEVSSMGIRVDEDSLLNQLKSASCEERKELPFHQEILNKRLPYTIGGGIGQSRICMFFLRKAHIGEVQSSVWPDVMIEECGKAGIRLL
ncbi:MAG TPA: aspartate--ammonia ligase [Bacillota bacterium]|nr:aspartate--ammonia ligase [Bacillota bacterium]